MIGCPANLVKSSLISKLGGNSLYENESVFGFRARRLRGEGRQPWREGDRQVNPRISYIKYKAGYKSVFSRLIARFISVKQPSPLSSSGMQVRFKPVFPLMRLSAMQLKSRSRLCYKQQAGRRSRYLAGLARPVGVRLRMRSSSSFLSGYLFCSLPFRRYQRL